MSAERSTYKRRSFKLLKTNNNIQKNTIKYLIERFKCNLFSVCLLLLLVTTDKTCLLSEIVVQFYNDVNKCILRNSGASGGQSSDL